jgi:hypothetical protein
MTVLMRLIEFWVEGWWRMREGNAVVDGQIGRRFDSVVSACVFVGLVWTVGPLCTKRWATFVYSG